MIELLNSPVRVLGIDPGLSGACAVCGLGELIVRRDFKTLQDITRAVVDLIGLYNPRHILIEQVSARPGQGVCSVWSFGKATGIAFGSVFACNRSVEEIHPLKWQNYWRKRLGIERPKPFDSRQIMLDQFPGHADLFRRKLDHGSGDAALISLYKLNHI